MMDTFVTLIGFLLYTMAFLTLVMIESPLPTTTPEAQAEKLKEKPLQLTVSIRDKETEIWSPFERIKSINETIAKLDDGSRVHYLDIGQSFLEKDGAIAREIMPDFLHLSRKGYRIWAEAMEPTLWSMLDEPASSK